MPRRLTQTKPGTHQALKNTAYESMLVSWLMYDGWQVFLPILDHGHQTDMVISDGPQFFRIQVKTVEAKGEDHWLQNSWKDSDVDIIVVFVRNSNWGVVGPAFSTKRQRLNHEDNHRFQIDRKDFLKEFHKLELD
jgi:hypothetical protein